MTDNEKIKLVIISGMSGAGKTVAMQAFEDLGYFCIDNMPPSLMTKFWELVQESGNIKKVAVVIDLRSRAFYDEIMQMTNDISDLTNATLVKWSSWKLTMRRWFHVTRRHGGHTRLPETAALSMVLRLSANCWHLLNRRLSW